MAIELVLGVYDLHGQATVADFRLTHAKDLALFLGLGSPREEHVFRGPGASASRTWYWEKATLRGVN